MATSLIDSIPLPHMILLLETAKVKSSARGRCGRAAGFSMTEMVIVISLLGVLAGIVITSMNGAYGASQDTLAVVRLETLNQALSEFSQQNYELIFAARPESAADEMFVVRTLEFRNPDPDKAKVGSPYVTSSYNPTTSSDSTDYRLRWTGRRFELLRPDQSGVGLKLVFDGSDMSKPFEFPPNFQMAGR